MREAPTLGIAVQAHLEEHFQPATRLAGSSSERSDEIHPIEGVQGGGVATDEACLVALQLTDEVPSQRRLP